MKLSKFTLSDDIEVFEGYTDGSLWNRWANVCFTKEQICEFMKTTPYDYKFVQYPLSTWDTLVIYWDDGQEEYPSSPLPLNDGKTILEGYFVDGLEFMEVEE